MSPMTIGACVYGVVAMACWRMVAGHIAWRDIRVAHWVSSIGDSEYRWEPATRPDWLWGAPIGLLAALVWPVVALFALRWPWKVGNERQAELREREVRIREAERELGIGDD